MDNLVWPLKATEKPVAAGIAVVGTFLITGQLPWETLPMLDYVRGYGIATALFYVAHEVAAADAAVCKSQLGGMLKAGGIC